MKIVEKTAFSDLSNNGLPIKIEHPAEGVRIVLSWDTGSKNAPLYGRLRSMLRGALITADLVTKTAKTVKIFPRIELADVCEYNQIGEGAIPCYHDSTLLPDVRVQKIVLTVKYTTGGGLVMDNDETIKILLSDLPSDTDGYIEVYQMESPLRTGTIQQWHEMSIGDKQRNKEFKAVDVKEIMFILGEDRTSAIERITFDYTNGKNTTYLPEEVEFEQYDINDLVSFCDNGSSRQGFDTLAFLQVEACNTIDIETDGTGLQFYTVSNKPVTSVIDAAEINEGLESTTEAGEAFAAVQVEEQKQK